MLSNSTSPRPRHPTTFTHKHPPPKHALSQPKFTPSSSSSSTTSSTSPNPASRHRSPSPSISTPFGPRPTSLLHQSLKSRIRSLVHPRTLVLGLLFTFFLVLLGVLRGDEDGVESFEMGEEYLMGGGGGDGEVGYGDSWAAGFQANGWRSKGKGSFFDTGRSLTKDSRGGDYDGSVLRLLEEEEEDVEDGEELIFEGEKVDLRKELLQTRYLGGLPGYTVLENLYLHSGQFISVTSDSDSSAPDSVAQSKGNTRNKGKTMPSAGKIIAKDTNRWFKTIKESTITDHFDFSSSSPPNSNPTIDSTPSSEPALASFLPGTTFIFLDPPGPAGFLSFYSHFLTEVLAGGWAAYADAMTSGGDYSDDKGVDGDGKGSGSGSGSGWGDLELPRRWWFVKCKEEGTAGWIDREGMNPRLLSLISPKSKIETALEFNTRSLSSSPTILQRVVIIERAAAHAGGERTHKWGKMNGEVAFRLGEEREVRDNGRGGWKWREGEGVWEGLRRGAMKTLKVKESKRKEGKPMIVYLDSQKEHRRLNDQDHLNLIESLKSLLDIADVHIYNLRNMEKNQIIEYMSRADVVIAVHSDVLMHQMWMRNGPLTTVVEIFDEGGFSPDWALFTKTLGHRYLALHKETVHTEAAWQKFGRAQTPGFSSSEIRLSGDFVAKTLRELILDPDTVDLNNKLEKWPLD